jgi:hypothetical protein
MLTLVEGHRAHQLLPQRRAHADAALGGVPTCRSSSPATSSRRWAKSGCCTRSGCAPRAWRACTCAAPRSRAAASAGATASTTSAPRSWGW